MAEYVKLYCIKDMLQGTVDDRVVPYNPRENFEMIRTFFKAVDDWDCTPEEYFNDDTDISVWEEYVILEDGQIVARAAIWKYSENAWEVAGVKTLPAYRKKGYGRAVVHFCAAKIVEQGRTATITTGENNAAMIATAKKAGFQWG